MHHLAPIMSKCRVQDSSDTTGNIDASSWPVLTGDREVALGHYGESWENHGGSLGCPEERAPWGSPSITESPSGPLWWATDENDACPGFSLRATVSNKPAVDEDLPWATTDLGSGALAQSPSWQTPATLWALFREPKQLKSFRKKLSDPWHRVTRPFELSLAKD